MQNSRVHTLKVLLLMEKNEINEIIIYVTMIYWINV